MLSYVVLLLETFRKEAQAHDADTGARLGVQVRGRPCGVLAAASLWQVALGSTQK